MGRLRLVYMGFWIGDTLVDEKLVSVLVFFESRFYMELFYFKKRSFLFGLLFLGVVHAELFLYDLVVLFYNFLMIFIYLYL